MKQIFWLCLRMKQITAEDLHKRKSKIATMSGPSALYQRLLALLIISLLLLTSSVTSAKRPGQCEACTVLVETFKKGLKKTEGQHFAGGNTAWEEGSLGKYAKSETRFVEILEHTCQKDEKLKELIGIKVDSAMEHVCHAIVEEHEEIIENWYMHKQIVYPDLFRWLCIEQLALCCPTGTYGPQCSPCPAAPVDNSRICFGRGSCDGDGTRIGSGKCKCEKGYVGNLCRHCAADYYQNEANDTHVTCLPCHESCKGGCTDGSPATCKDCKKGWQRNEENACTDVDECATDEPCYLDPHANCVNTVGSYRCDCEKNYKKQADKCVVDVEALAKHYMDEAKNKTGNETEENNENEEEDDNKSEETAAEDAEVETELEESNGDNEMEEDPKKDNNADDVAAEKNEAEEKVEL